MSTPTYLSEQFFCLVGWIPFYKEQKLPLTFMTEGGNDRNCKSFGIFHGTQAPHLQKKWHSHSSHTRQGRIIWTKFKLTNHHHALKYGSVNFGGEGVTGLAWQTVSELLGASFIPARLVSILTDKESNQDEPQGRTRRSAKTPNILHLIKQLLCKLNTPSSVTQSYS